MDNKKIFKASLNVVMPAGGGALAMAASIEKALEAGAASIRELHPDAAVTVNCAFTTERAPQVRKPKEATETKQPDTSTTDAPKADEPPLPLTSGVTALPAQAIVKSTDAGSPHDAGGMVLAKGAKEAVKAA